MWFICSSAPCAAYGIYKAYTFLHFYYQSAVEISKLSNGAAKSIFKLVSSNMHNRWLFKNLIMPNINPETELEVVQ